MSLLDHLYPSEQKRKHSLTAFDSYFHLEDNDNPNKLNHISQDRYQNIINEYNELVMEELKKGNSFKLFNRLGEIRIARIKRKRKLVDFYLTKKEGRVIYHENMATNGYDLILKWHRKDAMFRNKRIWSIKLIRDRMRRSKGSIREFAKEHGVNNFPKLNNYY